MATKEEVEAIKRQVEIQRLQRKERMAAANEWTGFVVSKALGCGAGIIGTFEWLVPSVLPLTVGHPEIWAGVGVALVAGKSILSLVVSTAKSLEKAL